MWFQCPDLRNFVDGKWECISADWESLFPTGDGRLDLSSSPISPTPLCFPLQHLTLSQWHYCVAAFSSRIVLLLCVSLSSVRITSFLQEERPGKLKPVKGISCIHALTVSSERSFSWALLRQMGRDGEEVKQGGKLHPWNEAGAFQSGDGIEGASGLRSFPLSGFRFGQVSQVCRGMAVEP